MPAQAIDAASLYDHDLSLVFAEFGPHPVHQVPAYFFRMIHATTGEDMGRINLRTETTRHIELYGGHIGYAVHEAHRGHHYAVRSVHLLLPLAQHLSIDPLWITCDPENLASRRTCELAGAELIEVVAISPDYAGYVFGQRQKCRYRLRLIKKAAPKDRFVELASAASIDLPRHSASSASRLPARCFLPGTAVAGVPAYISMHIANHFECGQLI
jgi:tagatose 1,6-diphosphate aldolase